MTSHWADLTVNSRLLRSLYSVIPSLESVRLRSFHLDWRGRALTLRIDLPAYPGPDRVPPEWFERGHDTLQLHVHFAAVEDLTGHISSYRITETGSDEVPHTFVSGLDTRMFTSLPGTHESTFYERV
ncbi:Imm50 family immunity protein [Streptomyces anulatus]|uniref:Imm50 family immunity protein n=1 Tax=Streptomyces anulatus TaxID=1892 RepID=UPI0036D1BEE7